MEGAVKSSIHAFEINASETSHVHVGNIITLKNGFSQEKISILRELSKGRSCLQLMKTKDDHVPGTCGWVLSHQAYQEWRQGASPLLWISGRAGCGKSVLARHLVEDVLPAPERTICHFFFHFGHERDATRAVRCMLHKLLTDRDDLFSDDICRRFEGTAPLLSSLDDLWHMLITVATASSEEIICVFDAYDECSLEDRRTLNARLSSFLRADTTKGKLKLLITSRAEVDIRESLAYPSVARLDCEGGREGECIHKDIRLWLDHQIQLRASDLCLDAEGEDLLRKTLIKGQDRTYIWAHLMMKWIDQEKRSLHGLETHRLREALSKMPPGTEEAYQGILNRIHQDDRRAIRLLMHLVVAANRPLSVSEINVAIHMRPGMKSVRELRLPPDEKLLRWIQEKSACFISVIDEKVYLFHQTAYEFLVKPENDKTVQEARGARYHIGLPAWLHPHMTLGSSRGNTRTSFEKRADTLLDDNENNDLDVQDTTKWQHSIHRNVSKSIMARVVVWYLLLEEHRSGSTEDRRTHRSFAFFEYCAQFSSIYRIGDWYTDLDRLLALCTPSTDCPPPWYAKSPPHKNQRNLQASSFFIATRHQINIVAEHFLDLLASTPEESEEEKALLENIVWTNGFGCNGLHVCARYDNQILVDLCMKHSKRLPNSFWDLTDDYGFTPLACAALEGHFTIVDILIRHGCSTTAKDATTVSPWVCALWSKNPEVARLFPQSRIEGDLTLERKLEITLPEFMFFLVSGENELIIDLLRTAGLKPILDLDIRLEDIKPLLISQFDPDVGDMLREYPILHPWPDGRHFNGLELTAILGQSRAIQACIDAGADVRAVSEGGFTMLHLAAWAGNSWVVPLLTRYFDVNAQASNGLTALELSSDPTSVYQLLQHGATFRGFPYMSREQNEKIAELLQRQGNQYQRFVSFTQLVIFYVILAEDLDLLKTFYQQGSRADFDSGWVLPYDNGKRSAVQPTGSLLHAMIQLIPFSGEKAILWSVFLLLQAGADVNAKDGLGRRVRDSHYVNRFKDLETKELTEALLREAGGIKGDEEGRPRLDRIEGSGAAVPTNELSYDVAAPVFALR